MRTSITILAVSLGGLLLTACGGDAEVPPPQSRPVKDFTVEGPGSEALQGPAPRTGSPRFFSPAEGCYFPAARAFLTSSRTPSLEVLVVVVRSPSPP